MRFVIYVISIYLCEKATGQIQLNVPPQQPQFGGLNPFFNVTQSPYQNPSNYFQWQNQWADRRSLDGWWVLYPFGDQQFDNRIIEQPNHDTQIDLDFYYPYYGFRFNYTFILPNGIIAFSRPEWIQPPYEFPNPKWPERRDASFIAPFFMDADFQYVADQRISSVWYRTVHRPRSDLINMEGFYQNPAGPTVQQQQQQQPFFNPYDQQHQQPLRRQIGYVEDSALLDNITSDIQYGVNGANGFRALHALIVTWERMAYGGAPKEIDPANFEEAKKWQNTYQLVLATDEIRSYAIFNYAYINWTSSSEAGSRGHGRGGYQSAIAGFNGGNGTGFTAMPYSGEGEIYKLARFSSVSYPGRWMYRVDEEVIFGGCSNASAGFMTVAPDRATMLGGLAVNVSGPCFRDADRVTVLFDEFTISCRKINMHRATCMLPKFHKVGMITMKISRDGGTSYPYVSVFYIVPPDRAIPGVVLRRDVYDYINNAFDNYEPAELTVTWSRYNLTGDTNARVNIEAWGYWEDTERHIFERVGVIAEGISNTGNYTFNPRLLQRTQDPLLHDKWQLYEIGTIRVSITDDEAAGVLYSMATPLAFYFKPYWEEHYGEDWALHKCIEWFEWDGRWRNYWMDIEACPCSLDQALMDVGRYMPFLECDKDGDGGCYYHRGAQHCVMTIHATWTGSQTVCCYDFDGWLMHSDDYEGLDVLKYYSPGIPYRAHTYGSYPYKVPPYIPTFSNWMHDIGPYHMCCRWAQHCEFLFWRRQTHGCQGYSPPAVGYAYGHSHFITFDGVRYTFSGKGYYVLAMSDHPWNKLMIQVRLEQPPRNSYGMVPNVTVLTGVAVRENDSDVVEIMARKDHRRWRYRMDVLVKGIPRFFDTPDLKVQQYRGFNLWSPSRNFDQSEIHVQLKSGVGVRVQEFNGILDVMVTLPKSYNMTHKRRGFYGDADGHAPPEEAYSTGRVQEFYKTYGLLGVYDNDPSDDLLPLDTMSPVRTTNLIGYDPGARRSIYYDFGKKWRVDGSSRFIGPILFQTILQPIYNPQLFSDAYYEPNFNEIRVPVNATLLLTDRAVVDACQAHFPCQHDYIATGRRDIAQSSLRKETTFLDMRSKGSQILISCGAIYKAFGVRKSPPGNNYLDGVTVTMDCRPDFFMHGDAKRTCANGLWSPGWHVWCRLRTEENILRWATGICSVILLVLTVVAIFGCCYLRNIRPTVRRTALTKTPMYRKLSTTLLGSHRHPYVLPPPQAQRALLPPPPHGDVPKISAVSESERSSAASTPEPQPPVGGRFLTAEHAMDEDRMSYTPYTDAEWPARQTHMERQFMRPRSRSGVEAETSQPTSRRGSFAASVTGSASIKQMREERAPSPNIASAPIREFDREPPGARQSRKQIRSLSVAHAPSGIGAPPHAHTHGLHALGRHTDEGVGDVPRSRSRSINVVSQQRQDHAESFRSPYPDFQPPAGLPPLFEWTRPGRKSSLPTFAPRGMPPEFEEIEMELKSAALGMPTASKVEATIEETAEEAETSSGDVDADVNESSGASGGDARRHPRMDDRHLATTDHKQSAMTYRSEAVQQKREKRESDV